MASSILKSLHGLSILYFYSGNDLIEYLFLPFAGFLLKRSAKTNGWGRKWFVLNEKTGKVKKAAKPFIVGYPFLIYRSTSVELLLFLLFIQCLTRRSCF